MKLLSPLTGDDQSKDIDANKDDLKEHAKDPEGNKDAFEPDRPLVRRTAHCGVTISAREASADGRINTASGYPTGTNARRPQHKKIRWRARWRLETPAGARRLVFKKSVDGLATWVDLAAASPAPKSFALPALGIVAAEESSRGGLVA